MPLSALYDLPPLSLSVDWHKLINTSQHSDAKNAQVHPFNMCWTIEGYKLHEMNTMITAPYPKKFMSTKWKLQLSPNHDIGSNRSYISLWLECSVDTNVDLQLPTTLSITIKSANDRTDYTQCAVSDQIHTIYSKQNLSWVFPRLIEIKVLRERASDLLPNGIMTLVCKGYVVQLLKLHEGFACSGLFHDTKRMLTSHVGRDVTLVASDGTEHTVHKFILCARSPVFAAMFDHDTEQKKTGRVVIKDFKADVVKALISFMYTDDVSPTDVTNVAVDLLIASHEYLISRLQFIMEHNVKKHVNVENVIQILSHADRLVLPELKSACLEFIKSNSKEVIECQSWKICEDTDILKSVSEFSMN